MINLITILCGFTLIGVGVCGYLTEYVLVKHKKITSYTVVDGKTGDTLSQTFDFNPTVNWGIERKTKGKQWITKSTGKTDLGTHYCYLNWQGENRYRETGITEAEARGKMWCYLKESNLIKTVAEGKYWLNQY